MKKIIKIFAVMAITVLSLSMIGCFETRPTLKYDDGVVKAFNAVSIDDVVSQTAAKDGNSYLVTVITETTVKEYPVDGEFNVGEVKEIAALPVATTFGEGEATDLERAYDEALKLSGLDKNSVTGFDFDRDTYMGEAVFKVEIEDKACEYTYILRASDLSLIDSKTELKSNVSTGESSYIGEDMAKQIALDAVKATQSDVSAFTIKSILSEGRKLYKVSFDFGGYRYDVDIDALGGAIVKLSKSILSGDVSAPDLKQNITKEQAKQIALSFAFPEGAPQVQFRKVKLDYEKGIFVYEIEFVAGGKEYEFEIAASDGSILDVEIDNDDDSDDNLPDKYISKDEAIALVKKEVGSDVLVVEVDVEKEDMGNGKRYYYEVEVKVGGREYDYYVDAVTGEVFINDDYTGNTAVPSLSEAKALEIALDSFGLTEDMISRKRIKLEREDGRLCYEIELYVGGTEYSMTVDANNGKILEREIENDDDDLPPQGTVLTEAQARAKIKEFLGNNVIIEDVELEYVGTGENRRCYYEVEVKVGGREYDYYVDAVTGDVKLKGELVDANKTLIGEERAKEIALSYFSLTEKEVRSYKTELEEEDGVLVYEVEFKVRDIEYTVLIDAESGEILEHDISYD